jgi:hypothetical protein
MNNYDRMTELTDTELFAEAQKITSDLTNAWTNYNDSVQRCDNRRIVFWANKVEKLTFEADNVEERCLERAEHIRIAALEANL